MDARWEKSPVAHHVSASTSSSSAPVSAPKCVPCRTQQAKEVERHLGSPVAGHSAAQGQLGLISQTRAAVAAAAGGWGKAAPQLSIVDVGPRQCEWECVGSGSWWFVGSFGHSRCKKLQQSWRCLPKLERTRTRFREGPADPCSRHGSDASHYKAQAGPRKAETDQSAGIRLDCLASGKASIALQIIHQFSESRRALAGETASFPQSTYRL